MSSGIPTSPRRQAWKTWIPALLWLGLIVIESTGRFSSENTGRFLYPLLHWLIGVDPFGFLTWHFFLRKIGHVVGYAVLSILLFRAWRATIPALGRAHWSIVWARIAFFMTALVACLDEWHQSFLPSRTGSIHDVLLDSTAALAAQILLFILLRGRRKAKPAVRSRAKEESIEHASSTVGN
ncbi:MAG TPA: VanZ family protein [Terriglobales bacterium]|nr:VanZ family protein [Terriglobales bacterium]